MKKTIALFALFAGVVFAEISVPFGLTTTVTGALDLKLDKTSSTDLTFTNDAGVVFDLTNTNAPTDGQLLYDDETRSLRFGMDDDGSLEIGKEMYDIYTNLEGTDITDGQLVSVKDVTGNRIAVELTDCTDSANALAAIGVVTVSNIANNTRGRITTVGKVRGIDTSGLTEGAPVYASDTTPGGLSDTLPANAACYVIRVGTCEIVHATEGVVAVNITVYPKLEDLSGVNGTALTTNGQIAVWDNDNSFWDFDYNINDKVSTDGGTTTNLTAYGTFSGDGTGLTGLDGSGFITQDSLVNLTNYAYGVIGLATGTTVTATATVASVWYQIQGATLQSSENMTVTDSNVTCQIAGWYSLDLSVGVSDNTVPGAEVDIRITTNGTEVAGTYLPRDVSSNTKGVTAADALIYLASNDVVTLEFQSDGAGDEITFTGGALVVAKQGGGVVQLSQTIVDDASSIPSGAAVTDYLTDGTKSLTVSNITVTTSAVLPSPFVVSNIVTESISADALFDGDGNLWEDRAVWRVRDLSDVSVGNMTWAAGSDVTEGLSLAQVLRRPAGGAGSFNFRVPVNVTTTGIVARVSQIVSTNAVAGATQPIRMAAYVVDSLGVETLGSYGSFDTRTLAGGREAWVSTIYCPMPSAITNATHMRLLVAISGTGAGVNTNASWITSMEYKELK